LWRQHIELAVSCNQRLQVYFYENKVGHGKIDSANPWRDCKADAIKRDSFRSRRQRYLAALPVEQQHQLDLLSSEPRDDSKGEKPGSERSDEEHRVFLTSLPDEDQRFLESHVGLGNSQKAEVAWLERRFAETGNEGYRYEEVDVLNFQV
jgi:hypothetical protein